MLVSMMLAVLATAPQPAVASHPGLPDPRIVQCTARNTADGKDRRCKVKIPTGAAIRRCDSGERAAGHCVLHPKGELVAWAVGRNGARCRLSKKKTNWMTRVAVKVEKTTPAGRGSCDLYVALQ